MEIQKQLSIVVPYRDRAEHLEKFMPHMYEYLTKEQIPFHIFVIEQGDDSPFNRAKLLNVGYKESKTYDYFCFHDVDMLPEKSDYSYVTSPTHLASQVEQFNWNLAYESYFGGVTLFPKESLLEINGYSNNYWGWGAEDDDLWNRCIATEMYPKRKLGRYFSLGHERNVDHQQWQRNYDYLRSQDGKEKILNTIKIDGISTVTYEKISEVKLNEFTTKITVKL